MWRCEFHCHSIYSKDSLTKPKNILETCKKKGIQKIAFTDHNTIQGALEAYRIDPQMVIIGEEINTTQGELLAYFVKEEIPPHLSPQETIRRLKMQEAFISVAHPFDTLRKGHWELPALMKIIPEIDAIEIFNARCMVKDANLMADEFAKKHHLPGLVGSDAHIPFEIGRATVVLPEFNDRMELLEALKTGIYKIKPSGFWVHTFSSIAKLLKKFKYP